MLVKKSIYKLKKNILLGISGDSGSGKSIFSEDFNKVIGNKNFLSLDGDGEHKWERGNKKWEKFTHLDPRANKLHNQFEMLKILNNGKSVFKSDYDHRTGKFTPSYLVKPKKFIVLNGLHSYYLPRTRKIIDLKIYMSPEEKLRKKWKIDRDQNLRNKSKDSVISEIKRREFVRKKYIIPQMQYADIIFSYGLKPGSNLNSKINDNNLNLKVTLNGDIMLNQLLKNIEKSKALKFSYDYSSDLDKQEIIFDGEISDKTISNLAKRNIDNLSGLIPNNPLWLKNYRGLRQLFILLVINNFLNNDM